MPKRSFLTLVLCVSGVNLYTQNLWGKLQEMPELSIFADAVGATQYDEEYLDTSNKYLTVFAPTNEAIEALPPGLWGKLREDRTHTLSNWIGYHLVEDIYTDSIADEAVSMLTDSLALNSLTGETLLFTIDSIGGVRMNGAYLITKNIWAYNGIIHVVDSVVIPDSLEMLLTNSRTQLDHSWDIKLTPNPAENKVEIILPPDINSLPSFKVQLINSNGKLLEARELEKNREIMDLQHLPAGVYMFLFKLNNTFASQLLMVK